MKTMHETLQKIIDGNFDITNKEIT